MRPPRCTGCAFEPSRAVRHGAALLVPQPCDEADTAWSEQLVAVDDLGRITPERKPLGNAPPGPKAVTLGAAGTAKEAEKVLAHPR